MTHSPLDLDAEMRAQLKPLKKNPRKIFVKLPKEHISNILVLMYRTYKHK